MNAQVQPVNRRRAGAASRRPARGARPASTRPATAASASPAAIEAREQARWVRVLGAPFVVSAVFFGAAIASGTAWLIGPAIVLGPIVTIAAYVVLMLSSDANSTVGFEGERREERDEDGTLASVQAA